MITISMVELNEQLASRVLIEQTGEPVPPFYYARTRKGDEQHIWVVSKDQYERFDDFLVDVSERGSEMVDWGTIGLMGASVTVDSRLPMMPYGSESWEEGEGQVHETERMIGIILDKAGVNNEAYLRRKAIRGQVTTDVIIDKQVSEILQGFF